MWAAIWFDFFFTLPYYRFTIRSSADVTTAVLLQVTGLAVSQLAARVRQLKVVAITDAGYLAQIHETAALAKSAMFPDAVVDHVREELTRLLDLEGSRFRIRVPAWSPAPPGTRRHRGGGALRGRHRVVGPARG